MGNLYFLIVFGDDMEDLLGHGRYALLLLAAAVGSTTAHGLLDPRVGLPLVGCSGIVSAIIACYAVRLPYAKISIRLLLYGLSAPAFYLVVAWGAYQLVVAAFQYRGLSAVSAFGHLGGAALGLAVGWLSRPLLASSRSGDQSR